MRESLKEKSCGGGEDEARTAPAAAAVAGELHRPAGVGLVAPVAAPSAGALASVALLRASTVVQREP